MYSIKAGESELGLILTDLFISDSFYSVCLYDVERRQGSSFLNLKTFIVLVALYIRFRDKCHMVPLLFLHAISHLIDGINS